MRALHEVEQAVRALSSVERARLGLLQASVCKLAAQRELCLEFSWIDQECRAAVHRLAAQAAIAKRQG